MLWISFVFQRMVAFGCFLKIMTRLSLLQFKMNQINFQTQKPKGEQQHTQGQFKATIKEQLFNQLKICRPFPKSARPTQVGVVVGLSLLHLLNAFVAFRILADSPIFYGLDLISFQRTLHLDLLHTLFVVSLALKLIIAISVALNHRFDCQKDSQKILYQFIQCLRQYQRVTIELDLALSAILLISTSIISIFNFLGSVAIIAFSLIFLENYCVKKDNFYIGSVKLYLLLRLATVTGSIITYFCLKFCQNPISLYIFLIIHSAMAFLITCSYFERGYMIYRANVPKWGLIFHIIFLNSMLLNMWIRLLFESDFEALIIPVFLTMVVIGIFFHLKLQKKIAENIPNCNDIEVESNHLLELLQQSHYSIEVKAFVIGTTFLHASLGCLNPNCFTNNPLLYDSKIKQDFHTNQYYQSRASVLKFYLKCRYETHLSRSPKDFEVMLLYCEFLYNNFNNLGLCLYWINKLSSNRSHLSLFIKIKLNGLIAKIKQDNSYFIGQVYRNNLQIEGLIEAEEEHNRITTETQSLIFEQMNVWKMLEHQNMDLSLLRKHSQQIFHRVHSNSKRWKSISNYVQQSDRWRSQYLFFVIFLKNERLKNKVFEGLDFSLSDGLRETEKQVCRSISNIDLFDGNSCCLHTQIHNGEILIKRVSNHFRDVTGYEASEAIMSNLKMIIPKLIAKGHHEMVMEMSASGKFYNEKLYSTSKVYILNKEGFIIPTLKMYKEFVTAEGILEYVCFLRKTNERQCVILCDQNFQIHGLTKETIDYIARDSVGGKFMKCVNLISLIPELVRLSKFESNLLYGEDLVPSLKSLSSLKKVETEDSLKQKQASSKLLHLKSSNRVQGKYQLTYPQSKFEEYAISYQNHIREIDLGDTEKYYECIKKLSNKITHGEHQKFGCELQLNQIKNYSMHFYQVKLKKLRTNRPNQFFPSQMMLLSSGLDLDLPVSAKAFGPSDKIRSFATENVNIFFKEDSNQAPQSNSYISYARAVWVLFFAAFSLVYMVRVALMCSSYARMSKHITNQDSTVQASVLSSRLANEYQLLLLNVSLVEGEDSSNEIQGLTEELKDVINSDFMKKVIFDQSINSHTQYSARSQIEVKFDEIDLFYFMEGLIQTLSHKDLSSLNSNRQLQGMFVEYQFPSLSNCLNHTRDRIASNLEQEQASMQNHYITFFMVEALVILISLSLTTCFTYRFFGSMMEMLKIHCYFSPKDIRKVKAYLLNIYSIFKNMQQVQAIAEIQSSSRQLQRNSANNSEPNKHYESPQSNNMNKKSKNIRMGRHIKAEKYLHFIKIILTFVCITIAAVLVNIHLNSLLIPIQHLKDAQLAHYRWIPTHYLTAQIISYGYRASSIPQFTTAAYSLLLSNLEALQKMTYTANPQFDDSIYSEIRDFYFGNVCDNFNTMTDLGITVDQCLTIANSSFHNGIREYSHYQYDIVSKILHEGFTPSFGLVRSYFRSIEVFHVLSGNFIKHLNEQYTNLTQKTLFEVKIFAISIAIFILAMMAFVKAAICGLLLKEYQFYKNFYTNMMPQYLISEQKVIKSKLSVINFL